MIELADLETRYTNVASHSLVLSANTLLATDLAVTRSTVIASMAGSGGTDWMLLALRTAVDLGPDLSSAKPDRLAGRGEGWFEPE